MPIKTKKRKFRIFKSFNGYWNWVIPKGGAAVMMTREEFKKALKHAWEYSVLSTLNQQAGH